MNAIFYLYLVCSHPNDISLPTYTALAYAFVSNHRLTLGPSFLASIYAATELSLDKEAMPPQIFKNIYIYIIYMCTNFSNFIL